MKLPTKVPDVNCRYGAPMGRRDHDETGGEPTKAGLVALRWVDGDYDEGGAYWGGGPDRIYWLRDDNGKLSVFIRAGTREKAIEIAANHWPHVSIYGVTKS